MKIKWEVYDEYVGECRPHVTVIDDNVLAKCDEWNREYFIQESIQKDFNRKITWTEISREKGD